MLDYEFNILLPIHYDEVIQFLQHNFFADEPLNKSLKMTQKGESHPELERHSLTTLADGISLGVWCNGKVHIESLKILFN